MRPVRNLHQRQRNRRRHRSLQTGKRGISQGRLPLQRSAVLQLLRMKQMPCRIASARGGCRF
jgi:hypothetical protein